jgi:hypothetical protein
MCPELDTAGILPIVRIVGQTGKTGQLGETVTNCTCQSNWTKHQFEGERRIRALLDKKGKWDKALEANIIRIMEQTDISNDMDAWARIGRMQQMVRRAKSRINMDIRKIADEYGIPATGDIQDELPFTDI